MGNSQNDHTGVSNPDTPIRPRLRLSLKVHIVGIALSLVSLFLGFLPLVKGEPLEPHNQLEVIIGFVIVFTTGALGGVFLQDELFDEIRRDRERQSEALREMELRILGQTRTIGTDLEPFATLREHAWSREVMKSLAQAVIQWKGRFDQERLETSIKEAFSKALDDLRAREEIYPKERESDRIVKLQELIRHSQHHIHAVTLDLGDYLTDTFGVRGAEARWIARVEVRRILVLQKDVLNGQNRDKHQIVERLGRAHEDEHKELRVVTFEDLPRVLKKGLVRSFLICDNEVVSESYSIPEGSIDGYVSYNRSKDLAKLRPLFDNLWQHADPWRSHEQR